MLAAAVMLRQQKTVISDEEPGILSQLPLLREARPWGLLAGVFLAGISFIAFMNYLAMYARDDRQLSVEVCGELLMIIGAVGMFAGVICGILADRLGIRPVIALMCLAFLIAAALVSVDADIPGLYVAAGLFGSAYVGYFAMVPAYIGKDTRQHWRPVCLAGQTLPWPVVRCWGIFWAAGVKLCWVTSARRTSVQQSSPWYLLC
ncbi:MFS transporter [Aliamphritea spongicola]|nr:MFS transporter [Aliamphritea spongicola]